MSGIFERGEGDCVFAAAGEFREKLSVCKLVIYLMHSAVLFTGTTTDLRF